MTKHELLAYLDETDSADAHQIANAFGIHYATAAMALLRAARQGLADRYLDSDTPAYWYRLSARGQERLAYFERDDS
jgi:predicted ArsR family transcriptional regulator